MTELIQFDTAYRAIMIAKDVDEVKQIRDKAEALRLYLKKQGESLEMQNTCAEIRLRAERRAGELLKDMRENGKRADSGEYHGNQYQNGSSHDVTTLSSLGVTKMQSSRFQAVASIPESIFEAGIIDIKVRREELTTKYLLAIAKNGGNGMAVYYSSETPEWYTPPRIIERVIRVLGEIDLDPCSNPGKPNIPAHQHYTQQDNGLSKPWHGRVYMNPPYGREIKDWTDYLICEWDKGHTIEAIALTPARTDTEWFRALEPFVRCFIYGRLIFSEHENSAPFPSMAVYLGSNPDLFKAAFRELGGIYRIDQ